MDGIRGQVSKFELANGQKFVRLLGIENLELTMKEISASSAERLDSAETSCGGD